MLPIESNPLPLGHIKHGCSFIWQYLVKFPLRFFAENRQLKANIKNIENMVFFSFRGSDRTFCFLC